MKDRRQIGGRYLARVRGAFRSGQRCLRQPVGHPANPESDVATRATRAPTVAKTPARSENLDPHLPLFFAGDLAAQSL
jgi:hypothetical protein